MEELFYDPFADEDKQQFDADNSFAELFMRYQEDKIHHDDSADRFVRDTQALLLDAQYSGQFEAFQSIAAQMHNLCMVDHMLQASSEQRGLFSATDDHDHSTHDTKETDTHSFKKKKKLLSNRGKERHAVMASGWLQLLIERYARKAHK